MTLIDCPFDGWTEPQLQKYVREMTQSHGDLSRAEIRLLEAFGHTLPIPKETNQMPQIHKIIIKPIGKPVTACGIKLDALYPQSNHALIEGGDALIGATTKDDAVAECVSCLRYIRAIDTMRKQQRKPTRS
jgi:hypothetical protein